MRAVHFGAGNIGRGFIGALLTKAGYQTTFVDVNDALIDEINEQGRYQIELAGENESIQVSNISGLNSAKQKEAVVDALAQADIITTAVGPNILSIIAPLLAEGLANRSTPVNVIACENMIGGSEQLKNHVLEQAKSEQKENILALAGFPNAAVDRIVPDQTHDDLLTVKVEPYFEWVVEKTAIKGDQPEVEGMTLVDDLTPYIERKLFTVNTGHAAAAYLGNYYGHETIKEAMEDSNVLSKMQGALQESGAVLIKKYGFTEAQHQQYIDTIIQRFQNPDLSDLVTRVGRAPIRKLGPKDRLVRPAVEYLEWVKETPEHLAEVIAAALLYKNQDDAEAAELQALVEKEGALGALQQVADLSENHPLLTAVDEQLKSFA
ncbi:mannitol-1-phosphate 5-dehydrogenase [Halobacillus rhizosphaerae]|uniref:mannitol-1-phosphate 5-dehydrogenase n=1 Tax=Halobacillus rhizosphaerae TaxID=3064889 RepID=UPI00398B601A